MSESDGTTTKDEYLAAVTIGKREPLNGEIDFVPYDAEWPSQFFQLAEKIRQALGKTAILIEHVGSTSVPGLAAKPVIDIVVVVPNAADEPSYVPPLEALDFVLRIREPDWLEHRLFKTPAVAGNLHVFSSGCEEVDRMLAFRNWLREHDAERQLYEDTKRRLASKTWKHVQNYADAKSDVVREILSRAMNG
jgi:GrpB-like predicted nucleotidyltransferase (UPF0157 family)